METSNASHIKFNSSDLLSTLSLTHLESGAELDKLTHEKLKKGKFKFTLPSNMSFFKTFQVKMVTKNGDFQRNIRVNWRQPISEVFQKIKDSFKFLDISSIAVFEDGKEIILDYVLKHLQSIPKANEDQKILPSFLPIYLSS